MTWPCRPVLHLHSPSPLGCSIPFDTLSTLLKHLISVPLSGLANRQEGPALSMFQVRRLRVPETISAETVREATKAYERKSLHLVVAVSSDKKESRETWVLSGREQGERLKQPQIASS
jgi:hypothetical protein